MADAYNATKQTIGGLLSSIRRERVIVPPFQRGYMWKEKHVKQFWQDITRFQEKRPFKGEPDQYFLGPIVTLAGEKGKNKVWLLDGQQRLATATILFSVIRDLAKENKTDAGAILAHETQTQYIKKSEAEYALQLGDTDEVYFRETIQMDAATGRKPTIRTHHNIRTARRVLMEKTRTHVGDPATLAALTKLRDLRQTVLSDLVMAEIPVGSESDAFQIFETLNARGLGLQAPDLLLNYLMREAIPKTDRKAIRNFWTEMLNGLKRFDINDFLRHLWVSKYGDLKARQLFVALKDKIEGDKTLSSKDFAQSCAEACTNYVHILTVDKDAINEKVAPALKGLVQELDVESARPLLLTTYPLLQWEDFDIVVRSLLVFYVQYAIVANRDRDDMASLFYLLAKEVSEMAIDVTDVRASKRCANYIKERLVLNAPQKEELTLKLHNLSFDEDATVARYVLFRLANYIQSPTKEVAMSDTNLEHIYPQNPAELEWGGATGQAILNPLLWHLGNLTIYGKKLNQNDQNKEYSIKKVSYETKTDVLMTKNIPLYYADWNKDSIETRAKHLAKKALQVWDFNNLSRV